MKRIERQWMYERLDDKKRPKLEYAQGVEEFLNFAVESEEFKRLDKMKCPCSKCKNIRWQTRWDVQRHLWTNGFVPNYYLWMVHGEKKPTEGNTSTPTSENPYRQMVEDALRENVEELQEARLNPDDISDDEVRYDTPIPEVVAFYKMLKDAERPVFEGSRMTVLQLAARLLTIKCEGNISVRSINDVAELFGDMIPQKNEMMRNFNEIKNVVKGLQLPHERIDACPTGCMLFWEENATLEQCPKCHEPRYKSSKNPRGKRIPLNPFYYFPLKPRLQRFYASKQIAEQMSWHHKNSQLREKGSMTHPSDGEAWKHFDREYPEFASEPRNVRLGVCTDGFDPFGQYSKKYSCWPVILTPYNLPPWLCMKRQFMMLAILIPGPNSPKANLDVYMQPLIKELKDLWEIGINTYDVSSKQNFQLKAAVMWTINDFPAYGMLSGWTTQGYRACPYCDPKDPKSFWLKHSGKVCWFDCHRAFLKPDHPFRKDEKSFIKKKSETRIANARPTGAEVWESVKDFPTIVDGSAQELKRLKDKKEGWWKQSIFWRLDYWDKLLVPHNLDIMHIEKNILAQLIDTIMDVPGGTKWDNKGKADFSELCYKRPISLRFELTKAERKALCDWVASLKFPDGYASNFGRCVDGEKLVLHSMKSHDCHVFMQRLLPVALKQLLPTNSWNAITEMSQFFRDLCTSKITVDSMERLESNIAEILCKLEKIFPPSFFNSMQHLPIHLPYEAKVGGPVQYRWMYPFERFIGHLKRKIGNKARVEGSICNAFLMEEISNFCSLYYEDHINTKAKDLDISSTSDNQENSDSPELFNTDIGSTTAKCISRFLTEKEYEEAHFYVLRNCGDFLESYEKEFVAHIKLTYPNITSDDGVWSNYEKSFPKWLRDQAHNIKDPLKVALAVGPSRKVKTWRRYSVNGYRFRAYKEGVDLEKSTLSNGVCVSSTEGLDYYGTLNEIIELGYFTAAKTYNVVLFKCDWLDNSSQGLSIHKTYGLVDVNLKRKLRDHNPFVAAFQVDQVCYAPYPTIKKDNQWSAVFKIKARSHIDAPVVDDIVFQEEDPSASVILLEDDLSDEDDYEVVMNSMETEVPRSIGEQSVEGEGQHDVNEVHTIEDDEDVEVGNFFSDEYEPPLNNSDDSDDEEFAS